MMDFYRLILGCLVVWRVSHLLNAEDGPWDLIAKMRRGIGHGIVGKLFDGFYCRRLWSARPLASPSTSPRWRQAAPLSWVCWRDERLGRR